ncbi:gliding motility-associated C-terminal domain-containing protein [Pedobacter frigidisoli]|uniref:Gliding motility-associated C-terminal domain-containing protein n=1 Tax=Pedobacter frigidisoli TaxID=2530455 RepID=A0A4R0P5I5_9SPHI|nr:gliding motility-associated C-terminal domain-containing protein [Pedobacter frigidisoli]TCD12153.1 gliding motility-associated C-terminal domain-containing protein [Pedobacter frigidisoli]
MIIKLIYRISLLTYLLIVPIILKGQLNLKVGESFLDNQAFKQVFVSVEDHTVWALTPAGTVYYKKDSDVNFSIYAQTSGLNIAELTGFNESEMYFLVKPDIIVHFKNGIKHELKVNYPEVSRINDISIISSKRNVEYTPAYPYNPNDDYLAIATNKHMYKIYRGNLSVTEQQSYTNQPLVNEPDWHITNAGFKSVDFQHLYPMGQCFVNDHATLNYKAFTSYVSALPDRAPYPSKINCTLFAHHWQQAFLVTSGWQIFYNIWGTDEGLFARNMLSCTGMEIKKIIADEKINDLEESYALTSIAKQNFVFAATDRGLYYTPASIFNEFYSSPDNLDRVKFTKHPSLINLKINSLCIDTYITISKEIPSGIHYNTMCEKILWLASENGIKKIYLTLDQDYYSKVKYSDFYYEKPPSNGYNKPEIVFETCGNQTIKLSPRIPTSLHNQLLFQWFKDGTEINDWIGKPNVELKESGVYTLKITALCENIILESLPIIIKNNTTPEIVFNYPDEVNICQGTSYSLQTKLVTGYKYKWIKDGAEIPNANQNSYNIAVSGIYNVQVSNCDGYFETSKSVKINQINLPTPIFSLGKTAYCIGETAEISVVNPLNYKTKWFKDGGELMEFANQNIITTTKSGLYVVSFLNDDNCNSNSLGRNIRFNLVPTVAVNRTTNKVLCAGEEVTLTANPNQSGSDFLWSTGERTASIKVNRNGLFYVNFTSTSGCTKQSDEIEVIVGDPINLSSPDEQRICVIAKEKVTLEAESGFAFYTWNGEKTKIPFFEVNKAGNYVLTVEDINGCTKNVTYKVVQYCKDILIPNAFSPNGDNINDIWQISGLESDPNAKIIIYNRFGNIIYTSNGNNPFWDGKTKGNIVPVGVYYYSIETKSTNQILKGSVTIIK